MSLSNNIQRIIFLQNNNAIFAEASNTENKRQPIFKTTVQIPVLEFSSF